MHSTRHPQSEAPRGAGRRRRRRRLAPWALAPLLAMAGCGWLRGDQGEMLRHQTRNQAPRPGEALTPLAPEPGVVAPPGESRPTEAPPPAAIAGEGERPGNPAAWGEAAQIGVGRQFDAIRFDAGNAEIDLAGQRLLQEDADWLRRNPNVWLVLAGHCDLASTTAYAYALGMARALAAQDYLDRQGVATWRVFCISYGADRPAAPGAASDANALNNRIELLAFLQPAGIAAPTPVRVTDKTAPETKNPAEPPPAVELTN